MKNRTFKLMRPLKLSEVEHLITNKVSKSTDGFLGPYELMLLGVPSTSIEVMFALGMIPFDVRNASANEIGPLGNVGQLLSRLNFKDGRPTNIITGTGGNHMEITWTTDGKRATKVVVYNGSMVSEVTIPSIDADKLGTLPSNSVVIKTTDIAQTGISGHVMQKHGIKIECHGYDGDVYLNVSKTETTYDLPDPEDGDIPDDYVPTKVDFGQSISYHTNRKVLAPNGDVLLMQVATPFPAIQTEHGVINLNVPQPTGKTHLTVYEIDGSPMTFSWDEASVDSYSFTAGDSNGFFEPDSSFPGLVRYAKLSVSGNKNSEVIVEFDGRRVARFFPELFRTPWGKAHREIAQEALEAHRRQVARFNSVDPSQFNIATGANALASQSKE